MIEIFLQIHTEAFNSLDINEFIEYVDLNTLDSYFNNVKTRITVVIINLANNSCLLVHSSMFGLCLNNFHYFKDVFSSRSLTYNHVLI